MSNWNSRQLRGGDGRGDAGDNLKRDSPIPAGDRLLASPAEEVGVSALQPDNDFALFGFLYQELVYLLLLQLMPSRVLAHIDKLSCHPVQHPGVEQPVE